MKLWLDDIRPAPEGWERVKDATEFWRAIAKTHCMKEVEAISFDNDLGENRVEGWEIAKDLLDMYIVQTDLKHVPILTVHSANVPAAKRIKGYISDIEKVAKQ